MDSAFDEKLYTIVLAGLLHDLGKYYRKERKINSKNLPVDVLNAINDESRRHEAISGTILEYFANQEKDEGKKELIKTVANLVESHHYKRTGQKSKNIEKDENLATMLECLVKADHLSASERIDVDYDTAKAWAGKKLVKPCLTSEEREKEIDEEQVFVLDEFRRERQRANVYEILKQTIDKMRMPYEEKTILRLKNLFEKTQSFTPSFCQSERPNISLYAHTITTAAIAQALWLSEKKEKTNKLCLAMFKFSHIQTFIFNLARSFSGKKGAKLLRGRSVFVELLTKAIALNIMKKIGVSSVAMITVSSGKAFFILPIEKKEAFLEEIKKVKRGFVKSGLLPLSIGGAAKEVNIIKENNRGENFENLGETLKQVFIEATIDSNSYEIATTSTEEKEDVCKFCGGPKDKSESSEDEANPCATCEYFIKIGEKIAADNQKEPKPIIIVYKEVENYDQLFNALNVDYSKDERECLAHEIWATTDQDESTFSEYEFTERQRGKALNLDELNSSKYAAVKLDVDNLGKLSKSKAEESISCYVDFSLYMKQAINKALVEATAPYKVYTLFAGGDDLILLGEPKKMLFNVLGSFFERYKKYVVPKPSEDKQKCLRTLSGTYILFGHGVPISSLNISFNNGEAQAKKQKNCLYISFLPSFLPLESRNVKIYPSEWKEYISKVQENKEKDKKGKIPHTLIYFVMELERLKQRKSANAGRAKTLEEILIEGKKDYVLSKRKKDEDADELKNAINTKKSNGLNATICAILLNRLKGGEKRGTTQRL